MTASHKAAQADTSPTADRKGRLRKVVARLIVAALISVVALGLLEGGLRLFGFGYPTGFFVRQGDVYESNRSFSWRFFPRAVSRTPVAIRLPAERPAGSYRIFIIGGSAARGFPDTNYSFSRYLGAMLRERFPARRFEIANVALTAANSHVMVPAAKDCAQLQPDLFVVYMGNNEVVGPFGAGTVLLGYSPNLSAIRAGLWVQTTRIGQLVRRLVGESGDGAVEWGGMEMFLDKLVPADDARLQTVYDHFRQNLESICRAAESAGAEVLLCTVPVNLRHSGPFASSHRPDMTDAQQGQWDRLYAAGVEHERSGRDAQAIESFQAAAAIDEGYADLHFLMGRCHLRLDQPDRARERFVKARDLDALRFRADSTINETIRRVATSSGETVRLVDVERAFGDHATSKAGCPGEELFFEHVHPTYRGNHEIARAVFEAVAGDLAPEGAIDPVSFDRCNRRLALTNVDRLRNAVTVWQITARAPFVNQVNYPQSRRRMLAHRESLWAKAASVSDLLSAYDEALALAPQDAPLLLLAPGPTAALATWRGRRSLWREPNACCPMNRRSTSSKLVFGSTRIVWTQRMRQRRPTWT